MARIFETNVHHKNSGENQMVLEKREDEEENGGKL